MALYLSFFLECSHIYLLWRNWSSGWGWKGMWALQVWLLPAHTYTHTFHFLPFPFHLSDKSISALCDYLMTCVPSALPALKQDFAPCLKSDLHSLHTNTHTQGKVFSLHWSILPLQLLPLPTKFGEPPPCLITLPFILSGCSGLGESIRNANSCLPSACCSWPKIVNFLIHQLPQFCI